jgi:hypothetical protein
VPAASSCVSLPDRPGLATLGGKLTHCAPYEEHIPLCVTTVNTLFTLRKPHRDRTKYCLAR